MLCNADMAVGFFTYPPFIFLFAFFGVWAVESIVIQDKIEENPKKALLMSLAINILSTLLGVLLGYLVFQFEIDLSFLTSIIILFFGTVIIEGAMLFAIYYKEYKEGREEIFITAFLMNFFSYLFLIVGIPLASAVPVISTIIGFFIIVYLLRRLFALFETTKELPNGEKISVSPGQALFNFILFFLIILLLFGLYIDTRPSGARLKAKDARIIADVSQLRAVAEIIKDNSGSYKNLCYGNKLCINKDNCSNNNYDTEALIKIDADLKAWMPSKKTYNCFATADNYCISAALNEKGYYCVDSNGFYGKTKNLCTSEAKCP